MVLSCFTAFFLCGETVADTQTPRHIWYERLEKISLDVDISKEIALAESLDAINRDLAKVWGDGQSGPAPVIAVMPPRTYQIKTPNPLRDLRSFEQALQLFRQFYLPRNPGVGDSNQSPVTLTARNLPLFDLVALMNDSSPGRSFGVQTPDGFFPHDRVMKLEYWELPAPPWLIRDAATLPGLKDEEAIRALPNAFAYSSVTRLLSIPEISTETLLDVTPLLEDRVLFALFNPETGEVRVLMETRDHTTQVPGGVQAPVILLLEEGGLR